MSDTPTPTTFTAAQVREMAMRVTMNTKGVHRGGIDPDRLVELLCAYAARLEQDELDAATPPEGSFEARLIVHLPNDTCAIDGLHRAYMCGRYKYATHQPGKT